MLRDRLRRRQEVFALTGQVEQLAIANFERQGDQITKADEQLRASLGWISAVALLFGLGISAITLLHTTRLERQSETAESELRRLSGQLRTTQEQERKLLSRELHDQVGQMLTGLRMELGSISRTVTDAERLLAAGEREGHGRATAALGSRYRDASAAVDAGRSRFNAGARLVVPGNVPIQRNRDSNRSG